ncbi:Signal transduction histidine kinase [Nonomuraea maritima]|uniref:histidine kinase n=1 Tax=Nonomuraea maritima TaxID=683260 RepID=A0A1G9FMG4_9ACTN|nr:HAMP domain-containing sensor histidine kinase [Nonomuraea maritima]SDK89373.1 Signal transduction histidine kinase [Nonomuraea maritima]
MVTWRCISVTKRITLFAGTLAVLLSALLAVTLLLAFHEYATQTLTRELAAARGRLAMQVELRQPVTPLTVRTNRNVQIVDYLGAVVASTPQLDGKPAMAGSPGRDQSSSSVVCGGVFPSGECDIVVAQPALRDGHFWTVYVASPTIPAYVEPWLAATVLGAAAALAAAVTLLARRIVVGSLRPVAMIQTELDRMADVRADHRVPVPGSQDEIHDLAETVNRTLTRLHAAVTQQRHFTSNASHELRTPIAAIQAEVEDALHAPDETTVTALGTKILSSLERLQAIVDDLLLITRLESGRPLDDEPVDLAALVRAECRHRGDTTVNCLLEPGVMVSGDRAWLSRLLTNLLDNAERHARSKTTVQVRQLPATRQDAHRFPHGVAVLEVIDDGPGIAESERELVFQRFARLDTARDRNRGGTGLGLPIARQIACAHGGTLRIADTPSGAHFVARLPLALQRQLVQ